MKPFTLVQNDVSKDSVEALEFLLQEAKSGRLIGLAYGAMFKRKDCIVDTAGEAHTNPLFAISVIFMLLFDVAFRARGEG